VQLPTSPPAFIARLNIAHYRELLAQEIDPATRSTVKRLLAEEEAKLKALLYDPRSKPEDQS
jgi:hypothetical protein